jgi:PAS domain S-box-containing protein
MQFTHENWRYFNDRRIWGYSKPVIYQSKTFIEFIRLKDCAIWDDEPLIAQLGSFYPVRPERRGLVLASMDKILLVEDEAAVAEHTARNLRCMGYDFAGVAGSGEEAIRIARKARPALVLMDIGLPGAMDGIEAARQIHFGQDIPVIFLTGFADDQTLSRAKSAEPLGYIIKPFERRGLKSTIEIGLALHKSNKKRAEDVLKQVVECFRSRFNNAVAGMFQAKNNGELLEANNALARIVGYASPEELIASARNVKQVLDIKLDPSNVAGASSEDPVRNRDFRLQAYRKDGSTIWVYGKARAIRDTNQSILCYEGSITVEAPGQDISY